MNGFWCREPGPPTAQFRAGLWYCACEDGSLTSWNSEMEFMGHVATGSENMITDGFMYGPSSLVTCDVDRYGLRPRPHCSATSVLMSGPFRRKLVRRFMFGERAV